MIITLEWVAGFILLTVVAIFLFLKMKEKNRVALFRVLTQLAIEDMSRPIARPSLEFIQRRYNLVHETLEKAKDVAKKPAEKTKCEKLLKDLGDWRLHQIENIYKIKLNQILKQYHETQDINRKLVLLFEARDLINEGILQDTPVKKIDNLIIRLYVMKARLLADGKPDHQRHEIFEEYITKIFNSNINDHELDESTEFRELVNEFQKLHRKFKGKRSEPE